MMEKLYLVAATGTEGESHYELFKSESKAEKAYADACRDSLELDGDRVDLTVFVDGKPNLLKSQRHAE